MLGRGGGGGERGVAGRSLERRRGEKRKGGRGGEREEGCEVGK